MTNEKPLSVDYPKLIKPLVAEAFVVRKELEGYKYLLIRRSSEYLKGNWQPPGGTCHDGEKAWETALREIQEETGLQPTKLYEADFIEIFYERRRDAILAIPVFLAFVSLEQEVKLAPLEHDAYQWVPYEEAFIHLEFGSQRSALKHIEENFIQHKPNERFRIRFE